METIDLNKISDEQMEAELKEIQTKGKEASADEKEKLSALKEERQTRYQKKIDKLHYEKKHAEEEREQAKAELEAERKKNSDLQLSKQKPDILSKEEMVTIGGKQYYTDEALKAMVQSEELTSDKAWDYSRKRDKAELREEILAEVATQGKAKTEQQVRADDTAEVLRQYPQFNPKHPDHDPNDPLFKAANELWSEGYYSNPRGLSLSLTRAKKMLRMDEEKPDVSDHMSVGKSRQADNSQEQREKTTSLSTEEQDLAIRSYVMGSAINPETGRVYTEKEAIIKATRAKQNRARR